ncbi:hypothetical protein AQ768_17055 [Burkholderia pseudomallei]|nr:hypothetical protein AQ768_17055 [Burkholderia pseudomallei]
MGEERREIERLSGRRERLRRFRAGEHGLGERARRDAQARARAASIEGDAGLRGDRVDEVDGRPAPSLRT